MSFLMYQLTVKQGTASIKKKIESGEVDPNKVVVVAGEVESAKKAIGGKPGGLTDEELHRAVIAISRNCGLKTDCDDEKAERKEINLNPLEHLQLEVMKAQSVTTKDVLLSMLKTALLSMAHADVKKGKLDPSAVYDFNPNAYRIIKAWRKNLVTRHALKRFGVSDVELKQVMREALTEVGFTQIREG